MTLRTLAVALVAVFTVGLLAPPAFADRAVSGWKKVYGHSTSCAMTRASINSDNERAGGQIHNFEGCNSGNGSRTVPTGYLAVREYAVRTSTGLVCSDVPPYRYNSTTTSDLVSSTPVVYHSTCPSGAAYHGVSNARRWRESFSDYSDTAYAGSPSVNF